MGAEADKNVPKMFIPYGPGRSCQIILESVEKPSLNAKFHFPFSFHLKHIKGSVISNAV